GYLGSDWKANVALRKYEGEVPGFPKGFHGLVHFGMWVDDLEAAKKQAEAAGASYYEGGPKADNPNAFYEVKYKDPLGIVFELTHHGWGGAVKEVVPAEPAKVAAE